VLTKGKPASARLRRAAKTIQSPAMKFALAILVYLIMALILATGILLTMHGQPWLLILGAAGFIVAFGKIGCKSP
jgi:hypothetical protein